ncbi:GNAT family N-acetyltransferase [Nonomuraea africana]|uniref:GNAT superfamily N-acetyltransferase n=1 Tax=Nonomuraea africana TaxID=46171 RepID=A0ABR9K899_9ACTN|nr:GNAT family N-acetyltransferase [Nonomuraea africana]MBE1558234.1 GNAT superfamily N-acetyltransferase [Nonomuraea africana]
MDVLRAVHEGDGYPANWPNDPGAWLTPEGMIKAWVSADGAEITGHVLLRGADPGFPAADGILARLFVAPHARGRGAAEGLRARGSRAHTEVRGAGPASRVPGVEAAGSLVSGSGGAQVGVAAGLMAAVEEEAAERGLRLGLDVADSRRNAMAFYERAGWRRVASVRADWLDVDGRPALVHYYLR